MQCEGRRRLGPFTVPADGASGSSAPRADTVAVALRNGMSFYEGLQVGMGFTTAADCPPSPQECRG